MFLERRADAEMSITGQETHQILCRGSRSPALQSPLEGYSYVGTVDDLNATYLKDTKLWEFW